MRGLIDKSDIIIAGAGFFGSVIAERCATVLGRRVLLLDQRAHWGGNSFSAPDPATGIEVHRYGAHLFHTANRKVWDYVRQFSAFTDYKHRVFSRYGDNIYPLPINLLTICQFFGRSFTPAEAAALIEAQRAEVAGLEPTNLEEKAISLIGRPLYNAFIRGYTAKQWQTDPTLLPQSIISRLPVRLTFDSRYFQDPYEGLPAMGYGALFDTMLTHDNIHFEPNCDFFDHQASIQSSGKLVIYTGAIDRYFEYRFGPLGWRTVDFEPEVLPIEDFQGTPVMNYADESIPFTRIIEFRHLHPERDYTRDATIIFREFSRFAGAKDDPYYPIGTPEDTARYERYKAMIPTQSNVIFGGRLGTYRYIDMHQAIAAALQTFERSVEPHFASNYGMTAP